MKYIFTILFLFNFSGCQVKNTVSYPFTITGILLTKPIYKMQFSIHNNTYKTILIRKRDLTLSRLNIKVKSGNTELSGIHGLINYRQHIKLKPKGYYEIIIDLEDHFKNFKKESKVNNILITWNAFISPLSINGKKISTEDKTHQVHTSGKVIIKYVR